MKLTHVPMSSAVKDAISEAIRKERERQSMIPTWALEIMLAEAKRRQRLRWLLWSFLLLCGGVLWWGMR